MKLKHIIASGVMAFASLGASAATLSSTFDVNLSNLGSGNWSAFFGNTVKCADGCDFIDTYNFHPDLNATASSLLATLGFNVFDIDFKSAKLDGNNYFLTPEIWLLGNTEGGVLLGANVTAPLQLIIKGHSGGLGSYSGSLNLKHAVLVPEPGTAALLGLAGIGLAFFRRRKNAKAEKSSFSFA